MIPKIIHYCWFGRKPFSDLIEKCIESWRKYCPDYEIKIWNEDNSPMNVSWVHNAYKNGYYAFVADYVRFYALYKDGGVYLDTDMLLLNPIDIFLDNEMFMGKENSRHASFGIIGMPKHSAFCKMCIDYYDSSKFNFNDSTMSNMKNLPIITHVITPQLEQYGFIYEDCTQTLTNGLKLYKSSYFYPIPYGTKFNVADVLEPPYGGYVKQETYAIHLWNKSWESEWRLLDKKEYKKGFSIMWNRLRCNPLQPIKYYKKACKYFIKMLFGR